MGNIYVIYNMGNVYIIYNRYIICGLYIKWEYIYDPHVKYI